MRISLRFILVTISVLGFVLTACQNEDNTIVDQNTPPNPVAVSVSISSPINNQTFAQNAVISFNGTAVLGSGDQISGEHLVWTSNKDGVIGTGTAFSRSGLSLGDHTIILTATAPSGESGRAEIQFTNQPNASGMVVLIESPAGTRSKQTDLINFKGSAIAPNGNPITGPLAFEWRSDLETDPGSILGDGLEIEPGGLTPGLHTITLNATAPDGSGGSASIDLFVEFDNSGIQVDILAPFNGVQIVQGNDLACNGSASQTGGGSFQQIIWTSSMDGEIGSSETCIVPFLSLGTHRITMTATASDGKKGAVSTIVEVIE